MRVNTCSLLLSKPRKTWRFSRYLTVSSLITTSSSKSCKECWLECRGSFSCRGLRCSTTMGTTETRFKSLAKKLSLDKRQMNFIIWYRRKAIKVETTSITRVLSSTWKDWGNSTEDQSTLFNKGIFNHYLAIENSTRLETVLTKKSSSCINLNWRSLRMNRIKCKPSI